MLVGSTSILAACAGPGATAPTVTHDTQVQSVAVYLYPGSKAEIVRGGHCTLHENLTTTAIGMAPPIDRRLSEPRVDKDQDGWEVWKVTSCD